MIKRAFCLALFGLLLPAAIAEPFTACGDLLSGGGQYDEARGSTYVPMDSWIYPAMDRLHALGQVDIAYIGMRPWTRLSIVHMLEAAELIPPSSTGCPRISAHSTSPAPTAR